MFWLFFFFFKQKTAYEMRISDWSSDVCSSDLSVAAGSAVFAAGARPRRTHDHSVARHADPADPDPDAGDAATSDRASWSSGHQSLRPRHRNDGAVDISEQDRKSTRLNSSH